MSDGLFREEALRHHTGGRATGDVLRIPPGWVRSTFALLAVAFLAACAFAIWGSVSVYARGVARVESGPEAGSVSVFFAERDRARLSPGAMMRLTDPSDPGRIVRARLVSLAPEPISLAEAQVRLEISAWPDARPPSRIAAGVGALLPAARDLGGAVTAGEVLPVEASAGKTSLLELLVPASRGSRRDG